MNTGRKDKEKIQDDYDDYLILLDDKGKEYSEHDYKRVFTPFLEMAKDVVETGSPYKNVYQVLRDFAQPLRGLGNLWLGIIGFINVVVLPVYYPLFFIISAIKGSIKKDAETYFNFWRYMLTDTPLILKGAIQIVTTPLTWFVKMPIRGLLTANKALSNFSSASADTEENFDKGERDNYKESSTPFSPAPNKPLSWELDKSDVGDREKNSKHSRENSRNPVENPFNAEEQRIAASIAMQARGSRKRDAINTELITEQEKYTPRDGNTPKKSM